MRTFILAATALTTAAVGLASPADAQRTWRNGGWNGGAAVPRPAPSMPAAPIRNGVPAGHQGWAPMQGRGAISNSNSNATSFSRSNAQTQAQARANANANAFSQSRPASGSDSRAWSNGGGHRVGGDPRTWSPAGRPHGIGGTHGWNPGNAYRPGGAHHGRWGESRNGRWYAGWDAPGGWNAYRRPYRGWTLPTYWYAPSFYVSDWSIYGLGAPAQGYQWTRYYDDAVLVDGGGRVYDTVAGLDWSRGDAGYDGYADAGYDEVTSGYAADEAYAGADYPRPTRDNGVGGAVIGGVVGGVAGNVIAGRGNRLAGTLVGAGVGAVAGAAIDRAEDRGRPAYGADYPPPGAGYPAAGLGYDGAPGVVYAPPREIVQSTRSTRYEDRGGSDSRVYTTRSYGPAPTVTTYGAPGGTTTVVTVQPSVTTTTTTTEYVVEHEPVTYRKVTKRAWRSKAPRCLCK